MEFKEILSITGLGGLHRMVSQRGDGLIVTSVEEGQTRFVSSRKHMYTPLENISIYTDTDSVELREVFRSMRDRAAELPLPTPKAGAEELKAYMGAILPDYDREKVYVSDIKKLIRWYQMLDEKGILEDALAESAGGAEDAEAEASGADSAKSEGPKTAAKGAKSKKATKHAATGATSSKPSKAPATSSAKSPTKVRKPSAKG